jgi:hypothetical protein
MSRLLARSATSVLLAGAGVLFVAAAWQRWWPACRRGGFDTDACVQLQSHEYDYLVVAAPWTPVGHSAVLAGLALLVLAIAAALLPFVLLPGWRLRFRLPLAAVPAASLALLGVQGLASGVTGSAVSVPLTGPAVVVWGFAVPVLLVLWAGAVLQSDPDRRTAWGLVLAVVLIASTPLPVLLILGPIAVDYVSYDTAPWSEAVMAVPLALAALLVWPATAAASGGSVESRLPARTAGGRAG